MSKKKLKKEHLDLLTRVSMYLLEDSSNIDNILAVIADALEAKQIVLSWQQMTEEEAINVDYSGFASKIITEVEGGSKVVGLSRCNTEWSVSCKLVFAVIAAFMTMVRNDVMDNYTDDRIDEYKNFINALQKAAICGTDAIAITKVSS